MNAPGASDIAGWTVQLGPAPGEVTLAGEIDFSVTPQVRQRLVGLVDSGIPGLTVHLAGLSYIDSSGLALLLELRRTLTESGRFLRIVDISPQVRKLFKLTELGSLFGLSD